MGWRHQERVSFHLLLQKRLRSLRLSATVQHLNIGYSTALLSITEIHVCLVWGLEKTPYKLLRRLLIMVPKGTNPMAQGSIISSELKLLEMIGSPKYCVSKTSHLDKFSSPESDQAAESFRARSRAPYGCREACDSLSTIGPSVCSRSFGCTRGCSCATRPRRKKSARTS